MTIVNLSPGFGKRFPTLLTFIRHFIIWHMNISSVLYQRRLRPEHLPAFITFKRLLSRVNPLMNSEVGSKRKSFLTHSTSIHHLIRLSVAFPVRVDGLRRLELLSAVFTHINLPLVPPHMVRKGIFTIALVSARITDIFFGAHHMPLLLMQLQGSLRVCVEPAHPADELRLILVRFVAVLYQTLGTIARFCTNNADKCSYVGSFVANQTFKMGEGIATLW